MQDKDVVFAHKNLQDLVKYVSKAHSSKSQENIFSDDVVAARSKIRLVSLKLMLHSPDEFGNLEEVVWRKVFYEPISCLRSNTSSLVRARLRLLALSAESFYTLFILKLIQKFPVRHEIRNILKKSFFINVSTNLGDNQDIKHQEWAEKCIYQSVLYLGDIFRYSSRLGEPNADIFSLNYYKMCTQIMPNYGIAYNQLGLLNFSPNCHYLNNLYYFLRSLTVDFKPFIGAFNNFLTFLKTNEINYGEIRNDISPLVDLLSLKGRKDFIFNVKQMDELSIRLVHIIYKTFECEFNQNTPPSGEVASEQIAFDCSAIIRDLKIFHDLEDFILPGIIHKLHRHSWYLYRKDFSNTNKIDYNQISLADLLIDGVGGYKGKKIVSHFAISDNSLFHSLVVYLVSILIMILDLIKMKKENDGKFEDKNSNVSLNLLFALTDTLMDHFNLRMEKCLMLASQPIPEIMEKTENIDRHSEDNNDDSDENQTSNPKQSVNLFDCSSEENNNEDEENSIQSNQNKDSTIRKPREKILSNRSSSCSSSNSSYDDDDEMHFGFLHDKEIFANVKLSNVHSSDEEAPRRLIIVQPSSSSSCSDIEENDVGSVDLDYNPDEEKDLLAIKSPISQEASPENSDNEEDEKNDGSSFPGPHQADFNPPQNPILDIKKEREIRIRFGCCEYLTDNIMTIINIFTAWLRENPDYLDTFKSNHKPLKLWTAKLVNMLNEIIPLYEYLRQECLAYTKQGSDTKLLFLCRITSPHIRTQICNIFLNSDGINYRPKSFLALPEDYLLVGLTSLKDLHSTILFDSKSSEEIDHQEISTIFTFYRVIRLMMFAKSFSQMADNLDVIFNFDNKYQIKTDMSIYESMKANNIVNEIRSRHKRSRRGGRNRSGRRISSRAKPDRRHGHATKQRESSLERTTQKLENPKPLLVEGKEENAMSKDEVMRRLAKMRLASEINNLKTKVTPENNMDNRIESPELIIDQSVDSKFNLPPCLILDSATIIGHTEFVKTIIKSKYFMVIVPEAVIGHLDYLKTKTVLARTSIRFLEQSASTGNEAFQIQKPDEFPTSVKFDKYQPFNITQCTGKKNDAVEDQKSSNTNKCTQRTTKRYSSIIATAIYQAFKLSKNWEPNVYTQPDSMCAKGHVDLLDLQDYNVRNPNSSNVSIVLSNKLRRSACGLDSKDCTIPISLLEYAHNYGVDFIPLTSLMQSFKQIKKRTT